jgi:hypothetical protein
VRGPEFKPHYLKTKQNKTKQNKKPKKHLSQETAELSTQVTAQVTTYMSWFLIMSVFLFIWFIPKRNNERVSE